MGRGIIGRLAALAFCMSAGTAVALEMSSYYSPLNSSRPKRARTSFILLHTTEGSRKASLNEVHRYGEAHFFVDERGKVLRIIERDRVAYHAGRSMWNGETSLDLVAVGIEIVGYHDRDMTQAQYRAVRELIEALQKVYNVPDDRVIPHSMVAYGVPNRWHRKAHRGRKRCGMQFASARARGLLGLGPGPAFDPDVKAGRLVNADPELAQNLFGPATRMAPAVAAPGVRSPAGVIAPGVSAWAIARSEYNRPGTLYVFPDGRRVRGNEIRDWNAMPSGTAVYVAN